MKLVPLRDYVLIEPIVKEESSIIIAPDSSKSAPTTGIVRAVGDDVDMKHLTKGDEVVFGKYAGVVFPINRKEFILLKSDEVLARVTE